VEKCEIPGDTGPFRPESLSVTSYRGSVELSELAFAQLGAARGILCREGSCIAGAKNENMVRSGENNENDDLIRVRATC
jgi:hypothetical protein